MRRKRTILQHVVHLRDVDELLEHIQGIIDGILDERKQSAIRQESNHNEISVLPQEEEYPHNDLYCVKNF